MLKAVHVVAGLLLAVAALSACETFDDDVPIGRASFAERCADPNVVQCIGFDTQESVAADIDCGATCPAVDRTVFASGGGSLKMTIPSQSPANTSGDFRINFTPGSTHGGKDAAYPVQFGEGDEFYVQWRQRFSPALLDTYFEDGGGWKQAIIGEGDRPGVPAYSCTELELVVQNTYQRGYAQMYHSCGAKDGQYEGIDQYGEVDYVADQWMTFQVHVKIGTWYRNDRNYKWDSLIELWVGEEGQPSRRVIHANYDLVNTNPAAKYGKIWLLPYHSHKNPAQVHPTAYTWYDDLIISRARIPDPL